MVYATQSGYYKAIEESSKSANCAPFIDFMLEEVLKTLKLSTSTPLSLTETERAIINCLREDAVISAKQIAELRGVPARQLEKTLQNLRKRVFCSARGRAKTVGGRFCPLRTSQVDETLVRNKIDDAN